MATVETAKLVEQASEYKYGFTTDIEQEFAPKGLNENTVKFISNKKKEPGWLLEWRLKAYNSWKERKDGSQTVSREMFITPLIKAVQELTEKNERLQNKINDLEIFIMDKLGDNQ